MDDFEHEDPYDVQATASSSSTPQRSRVRTSSRQRVGRSPSPAAGVAMDLGSPTMDGVGSLGDELAELDMNQSMQDQPPGTLGDELADLDGGQINQDDRVEAARTTTPGSAEGDAEEDEKDLDLRAAQDEFRYQETTAWLQESLESTQTFLGKLRGVAGASGVHGSDASARPVEDTSHLERLVHSIASTLSEQMKERLLQTRQLHELHRALSRDDRPLQMAMAQVVGADLKSDDDLDGEDGRDELLYQLQSPHEDVLGYTRSDLNSLSGIAAADDSKPRNLDPVVESNEGQDGSLAGQGQNHSAVPAGPSHRAPVASHLAHLQVITPALLTSLHSMNEHTQVFDASLREAAKKSRSVAKTLAEWQREVDVAEASRRKIEQKASTHGASDCVDVRAWFANEVFNPMENHMAAVERQAAALRRTCGQPAMTALEISKSISLQQPRQMVSES